jgi:polar amino acid transport system substrate-binding protein
MYKKLFLLVLIWLFLSSSMVGKNSYKIVTENYPPFSYVENGKLKGISAEIVRKILDNIGWNDVEIVVVPWSIAVSLAEHDPNTIIFSITKTAVRKNKYKWVGPITTNYWNIYSLNKIGDKKLNFKINSIEDAKKYSITAQKEGAFAEYLSECGFTYIQYSDDIFGEIDKLLNYDVQLVAEFELPLYAVLGQKGLKIDVLKRVLKVKKSNFYIGFNKKIPDSVVEKFRNMLEKLKQSGEYDEIVNKYYNKLSEK